jgi:hypothetical protein
MKGYVKSGHLEKAVRLAAVFKNPVNRSSLYAFAATRLLVEKSENKNAQALIDSAMTEMKRVENTSGSQPNRSLIAYALTMANPGKNEQEAYTVIRNLPAKFKAMQSICRAYAFYNDLYKARSGIPADISGSDEAAFLTFILIGNAEDKKPTDDSWIQYESNDPTRRLQFIQYIDETD